MLHWLSVLVVKGKGEWLVLVDWTVLQLKIVRLKRVVGEWELVYRWVGNVFWRDCLRRIKLIFHQCKSVYDHLSKLLCNNRLLGVLFRLFLIRFKGVQNFKQFLFITQVIFPWLLALIPWLIPTEHFLVLWVGRIVGKSEIWLSRRHGFWVGFAWTLRTLSGVGLLRL